jgi:hypothetical protein
MRIRAPEVAVFAALFAVAVVIAGEKPPESHVKLMKDTNTAAQALRGHVPAKDYDGIAADAAALKKLFADAEAFWTVRKIDDAIGFSKAGAKAAADLEASAKTKNEEAIAAAARAVNGTCQGCHAAHRERLPDGSSEIKN